MGLLRGDALAWAVSAFTAELWRGFDYPRPMEEAIKCLLYLRQEPHSVVEYLVEFHVLSTKSGWNEEALQGAFLNGLSKQLMDELVMTL